MRRATRIALAVCLAGWITLDVATESRADDATTPERTTLRADEAPLLHFDPDGIELLLPHQETELERQRLRDAGGQPTARGLRADPPPTAPIRNCAEWEPLTGVLIRYPLGLPYSLIRDFDDHLTVHVVVSSGNRNAAINNFTSQGVDMSKVQWLVKPNNSIWTRDYGPWFVFDGNGDIGIVDHVYNRPFRPDDNKIPIEFGAQQGIPVFSHDMWHTGGNYMTDGALFSMSTDLVTNEAAAQNGMTPAEVEQLMSDYYGISEYNVVEDIAAGGIHHIDTWGKFLDEESVLIKQTWMAHYTYDELEARATLIASLTASTGRNYDVHRVYCYRLFGGEPASYTNSLIANERIYVPLFGDAQRDTAALDAYRTAAPGYDIRGYYHGQWITDDALHCRAKGVMDAGMLRVAHVPVAGSLAGPVLIQALVDDRSEAGIDAVNLHWRESGGAWNVVPMASAGGDQWAADVPGGLVTGDVDYYVLATDLTGREEGHPRQAPAGWHTFERLGATGAPVRPSASTDAPTRAFPNPFRDNTTFTFELARTEVVDLAVYDVSGRLVRRLVQGTLGAGPQRFEWDARDGSGRPVPAGVYFFRLRAVGLAHSRPVVLTR